MPLFYANYNFSSKNTLICIVNYLILRYNNSCKYWQLSDNFVVFWGRGNISERVLGHFHMDNIIFGGIGHFFGEFLFY